MSELVYTAQVERWGVFELTLQGNSDGNPFVDYNMQATFENGQESVTVNGFYDGEGVYKVRFMPSFSGRYTFRVQGSGCNGVHEGEFTVTPASKDNHGPVRVSGYHFSYEDGTPYYSVGTTAYVWTHQSLPVQEQTLEELGKGYFNKIRFCVFPKHYLYNEGEPLSYPYEGTPCVFQGPVTGDFASLMGVQPGNNWDFSRFNPAHFQHFERCVARLCEMGIQADIIMLHPYDRWGFSQMSLEEDLLYFRYLVARLGAYRNVWWSLANEYDLFQTKDIAHWEKLAEALCEADPYHHLRSIHNCGAFYDFTRPWITHCSIQRQDVYKCAEQVDEYRVRFQKPVVLDEIAYEGNIHWGWGNISGQEMVRRFWEATVRGGYAGHGETYCDRGDTLWWSHGGPLSGDSPARIRFLHDEVLSQVPAPGLRRIQLNWDDVAATVDTLMPQGYYLIYYSFMRPSSRYFHFNDTVTYRAEIIDTWDMTITDAGTFTGPFTLQLPGKEYIAVRITEVYTQIHMK